MTGFYWKIVTAVCALVTFVQHVKGQCKPNEAQFDGECYYSTIVARNMTINIGWSYAMDLDQLSLNEVEIVDILRERFINMSRRFENYDLKRAFCPHRSCESLTITVEHSGDGQLMCHTYVQNVHGLIDESSLTYTPTLIEDMVKNDGFFTLQIGEDLYDISNFTLTSSFYCPPGNVKRSESKRSAICGACLAGRYLDDELNECILCPIATYQNEVAQADCIPCDDGLVTEEEGSTSEDMCKDFLQCGPGEYITFGFCQPCQHGLYKPGTDRATSCLECDEGWTTYDIQATSEDQCVETCDDGWLLLENGTCTPCPQGTYLSDPFTERQCSDCPDGWTTDGEGTASEDLCHNVVCEAGEEREGSDPGICVECPQGSYNPVTDGECVSCGDSARWRTDSTGAISVEQCKFYCAGGHYIINGSSSLVCEICPGDTYKEAGDYYATQCTDCPDDSPRTLGPGSDSSEDCKYAECSSGQYIESSDTGTCVDCDYGSYQPDDRPLLQTCEPCPDMQSTRQKASTSSDQCEAYCPSGSELLGDQCVDCAIGYYKNNDAGIPEKFGRCVLCPITLVTEDTGATSQDDCNIANCSKGYYLTENKLSCAKCPRGEYQDERYQTECKPCPDPESSTSQEGSTSAADCTVYKDRVRYAIKIKFAMDWNPDYYNHDSTAYKEVDNRIVKQVNKTLSKIESYRQGLELNTLQEGSVDAHLMAKFYSLNPNIEDDLERVLSEAINEEQISNQVVDGTQPLPVDKRLGNVYQYAEKVIGVPDVCPYGMYFDFTTKACEDCAVGTYQPAGVGDICLSCPDGYSTLNTASRQASDCLLVCDAGSESDGDSCVLCEKGTYKSSRGVEDCDTCSSGQTTVTTGATQCIASCPAGQYSNNQNLCKPCPLNTYNGLEDQQECTDCPDTYQTRGTGSTSLDDCLDPCEYTEQCLNGGTCRWNSGEYICVCPDEYEGTFCQTLSDVCARANPCLNGATCEWKSQDETFSCQCTDEYKGTQCETLKDVCVNEDPCQNGGICEWDQQQEDFTCTCTTEYRGKVCDIIKNDCVRDNPCQNGATCHWNEETEEYNCTCNDDFTGDTCNSFKDQCKASNPCQNGGTCLWDSTAQVTRCSCTDSYTGDTCNQARATENGDNTTIYIGAGAGAGALLLVIIIIVAVCRCRRQPKPSKPPPPSAVAVTTNNNVELGESKTQETTPTPVVDNAATLPPAPSIPPPPVPESPPPPPSQMIEPEYPTPISQTPEPIRREVLNTPMHEDLDKTITTVAMSSSTERISHRTIQPPESPSRHRSRSRSPKRQSSPTRPISTNRLRRVETELPAGASSMPTMTNPLLEENLPPADYPFDPPPAGLDYPDERRPRVRWQENGLLTEPPPYSKKDPSRKKGHKHKKHSKAKKHVRIDTDRNVEHKLSVRSNASSHHTYVDLDGETQIDYMAPRANTRTVPGVSARSMTFTSPIYETLN